MSDGYNFQVLSKAIVALSEADNWDEAKLEWSLWEIYQVEEPETCLCSHHPIIEICVLKNKKNGFHANVGNVCVDKFLGLDSKKIFDAVKRVQNDISKALNVETIVFFFERNLIGGKDKDFYISTWRKRLLSAKQQQWREDINRRILDRLPRANLSN